MSFIARFRRVALFAPLVAVIFVAACGTSSTSTTGTTTGSTTTTTKVSPTAVTVTASTALCNTMSLSQVGAVLGGAATTLNSNVTKSGTSTSVNCTYIGSAAKVAAEISYLFSSNGQASYTSDKNEDSGRGETITDISGLGDAAFWGVSASVPHTLQVSVLKGNVLLVMTLDGTNADGSTMLSGAEGLARLALPSL